MLVEAGTELRATPAAVWRLVSDPETLPAVVVGLSRWEAVGSPRRGLGARYRVRMVVGSAHVGGLVEVVEFDEDRDMAWTNITGVDHRGRWRLRATGPGRTRVTLRLTYSVPGGLIGVIVGRLAAPMVRSNVRETLARLRRMVDERAVTDGRRRHGKTQLDVGDRAG